MYAGRGTFLSMEQRLVRLRRSSARQRLKTMSLTGWWYRWTWPLRSILSVENPGERMDATTLHEEGAGEVDRTQLIESVSRHFLTWVDTWQHEGFRPVHDNWTGRLPDDGKPVTVRDGSLTS
jgi:hypothetical protein